VRSTGFGRHSDPGQLAPRSFAVVRCLPFCEQVLGGLGLALHQARPGSWYMRATSSPAASRSRMTAMTWRLAAAFCSSTQLGSNSRLFRIWARVMTG
jgi:hypothetical protein